MTSDTFSAKSSTYRSTNSSGRTARYIFIHSLKDNLPIAIVLFVLECLVQPLSYYFSRMTSTYPWQESLEYINWYKYNMMRSTVSGAFVPLLFVVGLVLLVRLYNYMHQMGQIDLWHSLPIRKERLFLTKWSALSVLLLVPHGLICIWSSFILGVKHYILAYLSYWAMGTLAAYAALSIIMYFFVRLGTTWDSIIGSFALFALWPIMMLLYSVQISYTIPGFDFSSFMKSGVLQKLTYLTSPLPAFWSAQFVWPYWAVIIVLMLTASTLAYKKRKSEQAETLATSHPLYRFLRTLATITGGMLFSFLLGINNYLMITVIGILMGSLVTHCIVEMIVARGVKTLLKSLLGYVLTLAILILSLVAISFDVFGFSRIAPKSEQLEMIIVTPTYWDTVTPPLKLIPEKDDAAIEGLNEANQFVIDQHKNRWGMFPLMNLDNNDAFFSHPTNTLELDYIMADGRIIHRTYSYPLLSTEQTIQLLLDTQPLNYALIHGSLLDKVNPAACFLFEEDQYTYEYTSSANDPHNLDVTDEQMEHLLQLVSEDYKAKQFESYEESDIDGNETSNHLQTSPAVPETKDNRSIVPTDGKTYLIKIPEQALKEALGPNCLTKEEEEFLFKQRNVGSVINKDPYKNSPNFEANYTPEIREYTVYIDMYTERAYEYIKTIIE
ncbi:MAG TPA: hypothetical protein GX717_07150 [Clostridiaceae bacterium]|nr:hypothetical protein [Clostridiaceae bacterium]